VSNLQLAGAITGFLGVIGAFYSVFVQNRGVDQSGRIEGERLGHDELVAALQSQRERIADLEKRTSRAEQREAECNRKVSVLELQVTELLWSMERRGRE
jgi:hypothetical protein